MKIKYEWEKIQKGDLSFPDMRVKVMGGWLVQSYVKDSQENGLCVAMTTTFVPDPNHDWEIE